MALICSDDQKLHGVTRIWGHDQKQKCQTNPLSVVDQKRQSLMAVKAKPGRFSQLTAPRESIPGRRGGARIGERYAYTMQATLPRARTRRAARACSY